MSVQKVFDDMKTFQGIPSNHIYLLSLLLNFATPKRKEYNSQQLSDSLMYNQGSSIYKESRHLRPIPEQFISNSQFWTV